MHAHSRRGFLARTFGAFWASASVLEKSVLRAAYARVQSAGAPADLFEMTKVAEGVFGAVARPAALINCNAVVFENANDLLVVDSHSKPSAAAALLAQIRNEVSTKPVRYLVNTHFHWDHTQGNQALSKAAPQAQVISSTATRKLLQEFGERNLRGSLAQLPKALDDYQRKLASSKTDEQKSYYSRMIQETKGYMAEMRAWALELPSITFEKDLVIHDKAHELHLAFLGRGHTAGDVVVHCPQKRVIATGDLAHGFLPYMGDGYPREWPKTLLTISRFEFEHLLGGHGAPQRGTARMLQMAAYIEELTGLVEQAKRAGRSVGETQNAIRPVQLQSISNGGYGEFVVSSLRKYSATPPEETRAETLENGVRENIASIYATLEKS